MSINKDAGAGMAELVDRESGVDPRVRAAETRTGIDKLIQAIQNECFVVFPIARPS